MTRIVFVGSPDFAVPSLRVLIREYRVVGVVTQPDRPAGRGREMRPPPIKLEAAELRLPVIQPERLTDPVAVRRVKDWAPDLIVVAAFGQLLRPELLELPAQGCVNVHASLLPRWRGAAPIQAAIAAGDAEAGVTIMRMDQGMDTGGILSQRSLRVDAQDTTGSLSGKLSQLGAELLAETLPGYLSGEVRPQPQDSTRATKAPILKKEDGLLDPELPADMLERRVRAFNPWPGAHIMWENGRLKIHRAHVLRVSAPTGRRIVVEEQPALATADGVLVFDEVQPAGRTPMHGRAFLLGARSWER
ncbi:MAG: methionyl-tRNA formyltransferase [Chloroflexota bacterium]